MRFYSNLTKIDAEQRIVWGYASTEAIDAHGETVTKAAIEDALDDYMEFANIREMHQLSAVGTTEEASVDDKGLYIGAKIVDDVAWGKVTSGVYKGFSIGGKTLARDPDNKKIITKIALNEISLVDRPSNPEARFDVWKATGTDDAVAKMTETLDAIDRATDRITPRDSADALLKIFQAQAAEIDRLQKRIDDLMKAPAPAKCAGSHMFKAISKEQDARGGHTYDAGTAIEHAELLLGEMSNEERALVLIKAAHRLPRPATMSRSEQ